MPLDEPAGVGATVTATIDGRSATVDAEGTLPSGGNLILDLRSGTASIRRARLLP